MRRQLIDRPVPARLYKYLPSSYLPAFLDRGELLFRNLAYFRKCEGRGRKDLLEGLHLDHPDHPITIKNLSRPTISPWVGDAGYLNSIDPERVFIFCLSSTFSPELFLEFESDVCVEIKEPRQFLEQIRRAVARLLSFRQYGLLASPVLYYAPNKPSPASITNPLNIPFLKHIDYSHQNEYRLVLPLMKGLTMTSTIVNWKDYSFEEQVRESASKDRILEVGSLRAYTEVHARKAHVQPS